MDWGVLAGAICTLAVWTYLADHQNPIWELMQHIYIGLAYGWSVGYYWYTYIGPTFVGTGKGVDSLRTGHWEYIIPIIIGLLVYTRYVPSISWVARYPLSLLLGWGAGYILAFNPPIFIGQITNSFYDLWTGTLSTSINNWVLLLTLLGTVMYFFFTIRRDANPVMKGGVWLGRWAIMVALGAAFGNTVLYRYNLFYARVHYILGDWLHVAGG